MIRSAIRYIASVLSGEIPVSATTRLTFERHRADLMVAPENGWYFDKKAAERVFDFCTLLKHSPDKRSWVPFIPEPWQAAVIYIMFGWMKKDGNRRFNYAYIEIPKKNGKTTFAAVFSNYLLFFDGEEEAEVYHAATVEKQAHICFDKAKRMIEKSPSLAKRAKVLTNNVSIQETGSKMEPLGRDSESMEGINPSGAVIDEYHVFTWKNNFVFENIQSATVNRRQPLVVIITTSGRDKDLPCFEYRNLCIEILKGIKKQDDTFAIIYTLDETDDWKDPRVWQKANPNWNISVLPDRFENEFKGAINSRTKEVNFKIKNLNLWVDAPTIWIPDEKWIKCTHGLKYDDLKKQICYAGLDLSSHVDLTSLALFFPRINNKNHDPYLFKEATENIRNMQSKLISLEGDAREKLVLDIEDLAVRVLYLQPYYPAFRWWHWIPEEKVKEKEDRVDYARWAKEGYITIIQGGVIDPNDLSSDILEILKAYMVMGFGYDPAMAHHGTIQNIMRGGFPVDRLDPYSQAHMNMSGPTKEWERLVTSGELEHFDNPLLRWQMRNIVIYVDKNGNISPHKARSREKIDGIVAGITALGEYITITTADDGKIYKDHSLRFL